MANPLETWVDEVAAQTKPDKIHWCDGSQSEIEALNNQMLESGTFQRLNQEAFPGCYLHRSNPNDVARREDRTFICTREKEDAGPTNNWMDPDEAKSTVGRMFDRVMEGRTLYVIPYILGPADAPARRLGVELTDSPYVVANMRIMTRMGKEALEQIGSSSDFFPGLHSTADLNPESRYILHFPEEKLAWSIGSGYGGNALLSKKCAALRLASWLAREEHWLAEHMLILEVEEPSGEKTYVCAAFPSACGKTNFAMMVSPLEHLGYKVRTVGDDIAWLRIGEDGRLWAINPEAGFFGVVPGTSMKTNPMAMRTIQRNTIFTNVAVTPGGLPWWEGMSGDSPPPDLVDWKGRPYSGEEPAAHPNSRFTASASQCPSISPSFETPAGVPVSAIIFGGRRASLAPLVLQSFSWNHGVYLGATMASEKTAAASGQVGMVRRDPMAMLPFCGYNMGDYFAHWIDMGQRLASPPAVFHVNWFRKDSSGSFLWPGFGENIRVLLWILNRIRDTGDAVETPIGFVPAPDSLNLDNLEVDKATLEQLLEVDREEWRNEVGEHRQFLEQFGSRLPEELRAELSSLEQRLG